MEKPIETHSASFKDKEEYGLVIYIKTAVWMYIMELSLGKDKLDGAMQAYFNDWKFKHPYPDDFRRSLEKSLKTNLADLFEIRNKSGSLQ